MVERTFNNSYKKLSPNNPHCRDVCGPREAAHQAPSFSSPFPESELPRGCTGPLPTGSPSGIRDDPPFPSPSKISPVSTIVPSPSAFWLSSLERQQKHPDVV